ncbi:unnamed protein product [Adineta ricciae]|uniref:EF-hand domain-containing protein n=1 Tax=Adineta ricciae TaxID=249248 RepID=A0A815P2A0_ADIRI|nr:unnamed protein product [Adineta ricciae]
MGNTDDMNTIFQMLNTDGTGYINRNKLQQACPNLTPLEVDTIFDEFDIDRDNRISLQELLGLNDHLHQTKTKDIVTHVQLNEIFNDLAWYAYHKEIRYTLRIAYDSFT